MLRILLIALLSQVFSLNFAQADDLKDLILTQREKNDLRNSITEERIETLIPGLMRREGIDAWVLIAREYQDDPVMMTMVEAHRFTVSRRTVLMFLDHGPEKGVERLTISRWGVGSFKPSWIPEEEPDQWKRISEILTEFNPNKIGLNYSDNFSITDGISHTQMRDFKASLPDNLVSRIVSAERLAIGWIETRTPREMEIYKDVMKIAHGIIAEAFSAENIKPGITTRQDLVWWMRQRIHDLTLVTWFHPEIDIERSDRSKREIETANLDPDVIYKGDHVHTDFGITYLGLQTDTQHNAYVLRDGETELPASLKEALRQGNQMQDILTSNFKVGRTGNEILKLTREQSIAAGLDPIIYTHPMGLYGHSSGPTIGMWDQQNGVPVNGDYEMHANTVYAIELTALVDIPDWSKEKMVMKLEEGGYYDGKTVRYIQPRQTEYFIIKPE